MSFGALPITLRQLQYIVAVADARSFGRAAERCMVSQPSLSAQLALAEEALGAQLFERKRRPLVVTPAGVHVVERARQVLIAVEDVMQAARQHADPLSGTLRFGIIPTIAPYLLPFIDPALRRAYPRLTLLWVEDKTEVLVDKVTSGALDAAVLALEADLGELATQHLCDDAFVLATPKDHPLARGKGPLRLEALSDEGVMLLDDGHCFRDQALALCAQAGVRERGFRATSMATLAQMVAGGSGVTLMPAMSLARENEAGRLAIRRFAPPVPGRTVVLGYRPSAAARDALLAAAEVMKTVTPKTTPARSRKRAAPKR